MRWQLSTSPLTVVVCLFQVLRDELAGPVHALSLDTKTEPEASR